jgi:hypothetical protein
VPRFWSALLLAGLVTALGPGQTLDKTRVVWIYDCSQSHTHILTPPQIRNVPLPPMPTTLDQLVKAVADNAGLGAEIRVLKFGSGLRLSSEWTSSRDAISAGMECSDLTFGPSPIWDAVHRAAEVLNDAAGARAILMVTDGKGTANQHSYQEALDRSRQSGVKINIAVVRTELTRSSAKPKTLHADRPGDPAERLKRLADVTGGRYAELSRWDLPAFFAEVARQWR